MTFVSVPNGAAIDHRDCSREAGNLTAINVRLVNAKTDRCDSDHSRNFDLAISDTTSSKLGNGVPATFTPASSASWAMDTMSYPINTALGVRVCNGLLG